MATAKVTGDQKLFKIVCYMLILKVTKFQPLRLPIFELYQKTTWGTNSPPPPPQQNRVKSVNHSHKGGLFRGMAIEKSILGAQFF